MEYEFTLDGQIHKIILTETHSDGGYQATFDNKSISLQLSHRQENSLSITIDNQITTAYLAKSDDRIYVYIQGRSIELSLADSKQKKYSQEGMEFGAKDEISTPMPGKIVRIMVNVGDTVQPKQQLVIVESMKMENEIKSSIEGVVKAINFKSGDLVKPGQTIIKLSILDKPS